MDDAREIQRLKKRYERLAARLARLGLIVQDWEVPYLEQPVVDAQGPDSGKHKVHRGGPWDWLPVLCTSAGRGVESSEEHRDDVGFRICRESD